MTARQLARRAAILSTTVAGFLLAGSVLAQSGRPWVDPPRPGETPAPEASPPAPPAAAQPEPPPTPAQPPRVEPPSGAGAASPVEPAPRTGEPSPPAPTPQAAPSTPPARSAEPPRAPSRPDAAPPATTARRPRGSDRAGAAQELATSYLAYWSAPNALTLDATPDFYAPQVLFHGRQTTARALFEEKRRFVRRWPVREYWPRRETMQTSCDPAPPICTVRTMFDFAASNPQTGRRSQGTALLQLGVSFADDEPMIVFETSKVISRGPSARSEAFEDDEDNR